MSLRALRQLLGFLSDAQQLPMFTQFVTDELLYNPAIAGTKRTYDVRLNYRDQWVGFQDAPTTESISMNHPDADALILSMRFHIRNGCGCTWRLWWPEEIEARFLPRPAFDRVCRGQLSRS